MISTRRPASRGAGEGASPSRPAGFEGEARWKAAAEGAIAELAGRGRPFTSLDLVRIVGPPPAQSLLSSLVRAAHQRGLIAKSDSAPVGTVWIGADAGGRPPRASAGRRTADRGFEEELWQKAHERALKEKVPTGEILIRALREYLKTG